ncbi:hypothetical protein XELAEV_18033795mg [Xenopus laevis]|uniref:Uncharacterized protein n=1 Tax=Xenopus laevis TaxID=8355 RepID=A0A974HED2_XENLA|nr:hypothetical protein XELAEV_18033795mg [Xenopus laevis]
MTSLMISKTKLHCLISYTGFTTQSFFFYRIFSHNFYMGMTTFNIIVVFYNSQLCSGHYSIHKEVESF